MKPLAVSHRWDLTPKEAVALQRELAPEVMTQDALSPPKTVAGVDVGIESRGKRARAAVVVLDYETLAVRDRVVVSREVEFPYVPGLLSFRELPVVLDAAAELSVWPDLILCDGQGLAHPRRFGLACHLGVVTDTPTIGVGKTRLLGDHDLVPEERGAWVPLRDGDEVIGAVLRSRLRVKPLYVSTGHRVSLETAVRLVMACTRKYRLPETTRQAHHYASVVGSGD